MFDIDGSEILDINVCVWGGGGVIMSVNRDTMTQIKGCRLDYLFNGRWEKRLSRDSNGKVFLDIKVT